MANTKVNELDSALTSLSIGDVVDVDPTESVHIGKVLGDPNWENYSIPQFFDKVKQIILAMPVS